MNIQRQLSHLKLTNISKENKRVQNQRRSSENLTCCEIFHVHANSEKFSLESRFQMHSNCTDYILKHKLVWMSMPKFCEAKFYSVTQKITHAIKKNGLVVHIFIFSRMQLSHGKLQESRRLLIRSSCVIMFPFKRKQIYDQQCFHSKEKGVERKRKK